MSIQFIPAGIPLSSSHAINVSIVNTVSEGGLPVSASIAEYSITDVGPTGPPFKTISTQASGSKVTIVDV